MGDMTQKEMLEKWLAGLDAAQVALRSVGEVDLISTILQGFIDAEYIELINTKARVLALLEKVE